MAMQVPEFLLRRLYVQGSLVNTADGFELKLENSLGSGYAEALLPLQVDDVEYPLTDAAFTVDGEEGEPATFAAVSKDKPFTLEQGRTTTIHVRGKPLGAGEHTIRLGFIVVGLGPMTLEAIDQLAS